MKRNITSLANDSFDLLVVGGGIYGACVARDAALRGLSVALIERGDFGQATSANSLKIIHGGLRYLQDFDLNLVRTMISERSTFMRIAPHLVHPLPCLVPTQGWQLRSKPVMGAAIIANNLLCAPQNRQLEPDKRLPNGKIISKEAYFRRIPGVHRDKITGGALWYDAQIYNSERLTLAFIHSAADQGATVANYVEAVDLLMENRDYVQGVRARDILTQSEFDIRAKLVINACGAWGAQLVPHMVGAKNRDISQSIALNLVTRQLIPDVAIGLPGRLSIHPENGDSKTSEKTQMLFIAPWRNYSIIGTIHLPYTGTPDDYQISESTVACFLEQINNAFPSAQLSRNDVYRVHYGFLPASWVGSRDSTVKLLRRSLVIDHERDGLHGLITIAGVKYTSARYDAEQAIDLALKKLGRDGPDCQSHRIPLHGGSIENFEHFVNEALKQPRFGFNKEIVNQLVYNYGTEYGDIISLVRKNPDLAQTVSTESTVIAAQVSYAVHREMAHKLSDVVFRRTELGSAGDCELGAITSCARVMARELQWDKNRVEREIGEVKKHLSISRAMDSRSQ